MNELFRISYAAALAGNLGICLGCGEQADGVEPDARKYLCPGCGEYRVYGLEEAVLMNAVDVDFDD